MLSLHSSVAAGSPASDFGAVAQLARAPALQAGRRGFESHQLHNWTTWSARKPQAPGLRSFGAVRKLPSGGAGDALAPRDAQAHHVLDEGRRQSMVGDNRGRSPPKRWPGPNRSLQGHVHLMVARRTRHSGGASQRSSPRRSRPPLPRALLFRLRRRRVGRVPSVRRSGR
jgi:hypothetical protein